MLRIWNLESFLKGFLLLIVVEMTGSCHSERAWRRGISFSYLFFLLIFHYFIFACLYSLNYTKDRENIPV
jgi:hypothetical protein